MCYSFHRENDVELKGEYMSLVSVFIAVHILSAVVWVGGMFFAYVCLRPAAASVLEPAQRLSLWVGVFSRFFPWVWMAVILLPLSGYLMLFTLWQNMHTAPGYIHIMNGLGILMIFIFAHVYFALFKKLKRAVSNEDWPTGAEMLAKIRKLVAINLALGLIVVMIASSGRYL